MKKVGKVILFIILVLAPHTVFAGGFVSQKGSVFLKTAFQSWTADKVFAGPAQTNSDTGVELGDKAPFDKVNGGEFNSQHLSISASYVPFDRLQLDLFLPVLQVSTFRDRSFESTSTGPGDLYLGVGYQVLKFEKIGTSLNLKSKIPFAKPADDDVSIPLSTGQFDFTAEQQTSWAAKPALQFTLRTLYRYRLPFEEDNYRDEVELGFEMAGSPVNALWLKLGTSSLWTLGSDDPTTSETTENSGQQIHDLYLGAYWNIGTYLPFAKGLALDGTFTVPYAGQDYPRGITWNTGFAYSF